MAAIDLFIIVIFLIGTFKGVRNGLFVEFASFIGLLIGLWVALKFSDVTRDFLGAHLGSNPKTAYFFAFVITFAAVVLGVALMAKVLTKLADFSGIGIFNAIGGGLFGFVRALLIVSVLLNIFDKANFTNAFASEETLQKSKLYYPTKATAQIVYPFLKEELHEIKLHVNP